MGVVFLILLFLAGAIALSSHSPANKARFIIYIPLGVIVLVMVLYRNLTVYDANRSVIRVTRGGAPFLKWREIPVSGAATVHLRAWRVKGSVCFGVDLTFDSTTEKFPLTLNGSEKDLKLAIDFAQAIGATILPDTSMHTIGTRWLQKYLGPGEIK